MASARRSRASMEPVALQPENTRIPLDILLRNAFAPFRALRRERLIDSFCR